MHRLLRQPQLCPTPPECPQVLIADPWAGRDALPCYGCPKVELANFMASPPGRIYASVVDLDYALNLGFAVTLEDVSCAEFSLLKLLTDERKKWEIEEMKREQGKHRGK